MTTCWQALTRARCRVFIFDENLEKRAPAFEYFERTGLMVCTTVEETSLPTQFAKASSPEEWLERAKGFQEHSSHQLAAFCYSKAGSPQQEAHMRGRQFEEQATLLRDLLLAPSSPLSHLTPLSCHFLCLYHSPPSPSLL